MEVYTGRGGKSVYTLEKRIASGGEGHVYTIAGKPNSLAKIYKAERIGSDQVRNDLQNKIIAMLDMGFNPIIDGKLIVAWPEDILLDGNGKFQGYVMPRIVGKKSIIWVAREYERGVLFEQQYHWLKSVAIAYNLSRVVEIMHQSGIVIGDMNTNNILVDKTGNVTLIDADSFNITTATGREFKCCVAMPEVLPPELQGKDVSESQNHFTEKTDCFALAIHVFNLLCNNCHPFGCLDFNSPKGSSSKSALITNIVTGYCPYVTGSKNEVMDAAPDMNMLPRNIRLLFDRAFKYSEVTAVKSETIHNRPIATEWRIALHELYQSPITTCNTDAYHKYPAHYAAGCPWCAIKKRTTPQPIPQPTPQPTPQPKPQPKHVPPVINTPSNSAWKKAWKWIVSIACCIALVYFCMLGSQESFPVDTNTHTQMASLNVVTGSNSVSISRGTVTRVKFTAPSAGTYVFTTTGNSDTVGYLYGTSTSTSALVQNDDFYADNHNFRLEYALTTNQSVYVGIKYYSSDRSGTVTLNITKASTISTDPPTNPPTNTPSPTVQQVRTGNNTVTIRAGITTRVKFIAPSTGKYVFRTNGDVDTWGYLYSSQTSTTPIQENDDRNSSDRNFQIEYTMSANQTIYIGVKFFNSTSSGNVSLNITKQTSSSGNSTSRWPVGETCRVYVGSGHARTGPGVSYDHAAYIKEGDSFEILECRLGDTGKDWYKIRHDGQLCWVSSGLVELNGNKNGTRNGVPITN